MYMYGFADCYLVFDFELCFGLSVKVWHVGPGNEGLQPLVIASENPVT